ASSSLVREAYADNLDLGAKKNVFGISVDPNVFQRIKTSLENGQQPAPSMVNVDALVNYFAGAPARAPKRGVRLEVEASPAPVNEEGEHAVLRLTIDTPSLATQQGSSIPPVARDAHVEVDFNDEAVASYHRVGDANGMQSESVLLYNVSVTALYDVELRPHLRTSQRVATVKLRYRSVTDGKQHTIERIIHGHDLSGDWARASRRHRLASLGAVWGESLKGTPQGIDVARRAEELVTQNPKDPLARELAHAVSASGGER
ncbi:MAG TPA: von Willebrand factor type A domain-containing protein, partial [Thermoanaerobaculia bacterium]|nr:von Willebrand factor type A domain-containing protein [Thermoanaerobaculia bacterium]